MDSDFLVDPELKPALAAFPPIELSREMLVPTRAAFAAEMAKVPVPEGIPVTVETLSVPGSAGAPAVRVLIYRPNTATGARPAIFHVHGGGYVFGSPEFNDIPNRLLAADLGCIICSVDYRLAPETPHPGPVEDCYAALAWLSSNAARLGIDPARIGVKGESAGGGLAAALALLARDRGGPRLAFQHLIYPMIDDRTCVARDPHPYTGQYVWTHDHNVFGWSCLLGTAPGGAAVSPYAAAARAEDLTRLPPAFISVGTLDLFLEEDLDYGRRLTRAGVPVEMHVYPGAFHGYDMAPDARTSLASARDTRESLRRALHG